MSKQLPDGWSIQPVKSAFLIGRGRVISKTEIRDNSGVYPVFSSQSYNNGQMGCIDTYDFDGEYITWTTDGAYAGTVFYRRGRFNCTNVCGTLKNNGKYKLDMKFVASYLSTIAKNHVSYVGNPKLMNGIFGEIDFLMPPLAEQKKIAEILTSVDDVIENTQAQIDKLQDLKKATMNELLTKGIGHTEFKDSALGRIPKTWDIKTLEELSEYKGLQTGPFGSQLHAHEYTNFGIPVIMPKNMIATEVNTSNIARIKKEKASSLKKHLVQNGDILFSRRGDIGRFALITEDKSGWIAGTGCLRARLNHTMVIPHFVAQYLTQREPIDWLNLNAVGLTMLNLSTTILKGLPILVPPIIEQKKIIHALQSIDKHISSSRSKQYSVLALKKALMNDLLSGKVRVN